jgi:hypothetical protein
MKAANKSSDIDLFIITTPNSMWLNRLLITLYFTLIWQRKTKNNHAWKFCISFFITTDNLDLKNIALDNDIYLYFWLIYLKPIINNNNSYYKFIEKNKSWADLNDYQNIIEDNKKYIKYAKNNRKTWNFIAFINKLIKKIWLPKTLKSYKKLWKPFWIIINNNMLKFHNNDIRENFKLK